MRQSIGTLFCFLVAGWCALIGWVVPVRAEGCAGVEKQAWTEAAAVPLSDPLADAEWDVARANAFVRSVFRSAREDGYALASLAYLRLLTISLDSLSAEERAIVACHHRQLALILPDTLQLHVDPSLHGGHSGNKILRWWRAHDPLPATKRNERLIAHLRRVAYAVQHYRDQGATTGVDVRGDIYIRFGPPARSTTVRFNASRALSMVRTSPILTRSDFPENEYWIYPHIDEHAKYLFVEQDGTWRIGTVLDLIPSFFRSGLGSDARGRQRALQLGTLLEEIYSQLGTVDVDYGSWYQEVESATAYTVSGALPDPSRMRQVIVESREYDAQQAAERDRSVPQQFAEVAGAGEQFPVDVRIARFLEENGTTRTEVYWAPKPNAFLVAEPPARSAYDDWKKYLLIFAAVQQEPDFSRRAVHYRRFMLPRSGREGGTIEAQSYAVSGDTGVYHLRLQWQQHLAHRAANSDDSVKVGPRIKVQAARFDSLRALQAQPGGLEMSDLKPLSHAPSDSLPEAQPYPFEEWKTDKPLLLYFEVYHLTFGANDQTRYTVEYTIERRAERRGLRGWFGGDERRRTTTVTTNTGAARRASEYILLDLEEKIADRSGTIRVTVRVTDEVSGQQVERSVKFEALGAGSEES